MKKALTFLLLAASAAVYAQPKLLTQATVTTKTTIVTPDEDENAPAGNIQSENGEQIRVMRFGGDGETKTTTWVKNDLTKTYSESEMGLTTVIRDNTKKITTTIMAMMGKKFGFYATDEEQLQMRKQMDSMMKGRGPNGTQGELNATPATISVSYIDESKKIAGYNCKKALVVATRAIGKSDTTAVWYCPDFKIQNLPSTGGAGSGFGGFNVSSPNGIEDIAGFPMQYEKTLNRGRKMTVQVTKVVIDKEIADKEFDIPKDIEVKPMKDLQNGGGQGFRMRIGG